ncbi:MAG: FtsX-like permease family protein [Actinobacteria bacterium]|nr:FtsX-like permease family protein [Actinomycetota bacterium]
MVRVALRGLLGRKLRAILTAFAIVLGVATVSGTYVLTDSISDAFNNIFTGVYRGTDAVITGKAAFDLSGESNAQVPAFDESLLQKVRALPDVGAAIGGVGGTAQLIGSNGKVISFGGAPNLGFSVDPSQPQFNSLTLAEGRWPGPGQFVVDTSTAGKKNIKIGDTIQVQAEGSAIPLRVSGLVKFGAVSSIGGATLAGFDLATAQKLFHKEGKLDQIRISRAQGVSAAALLDQVRTVLPPETQVRSGETQAAKDASDTKSFTSFLQTFLLAFGGIALFVGAFVIANSLSITIAQRTREFATLRTLGASRRQVLRSVLIESTVIGVIASVVGLFLGLALARGLFALFSAVGFTLPNSGLLLKPRTIVVALLVGIIVTVLASLRPALRATRVPPIAAVREGAVLPRGRFARYRALGSGSLAILGFAALAYGLFGPSLSTAQILLFMGIGTLCIFFGVALFSSNLVTPLATVIGAPGARIGGAPGVLARENSQRNPARTGSTAAALMIGLALVTLVAMLASGIRSSFFDAVNKLWATDYAVTAENNYSPIPISVEKPIREASGVTAVVGVRAGEAQIFGKRRSLTAVGPGASSVFRLTWTGGSQATLGSLGTAGAFVDKDFAKDHRLHVGSTVSMLMPSGARPTFSIRGIFDPPTGGSPFGAVTIGTAAFDHFVSQPEDLFVFIKMNGGFNAANTAELDHALAGFPNAKLQNQKQFKDNQASGLNSTLNILYVLLALSVLVSLFGIVNTLVLTVFERTRELGMLRAVGMTRRQVRRMIRYESVITALIGAAIGITLGIVLAVLLISRVDFIVLSWPIRSLIILVVAALVVGLIAAIFPARRASRLNVLEALQYE